MQGQVEVLIVSEEGERLARYYAPCVPRVGEKVGVFLLFYEVTEVYYRLDRVFSDNKDTSLMVAVVVVEPTKEPSVIQKMIDR